MPFVRAIPMIRTPIGVDIFDYHIPEGMSVQAGDLLLAPFRNQRIPVLAREVISESPIADRAKDIIGSYGSIHFSESIVPLLEWTARRTYCSQTTVLKAWLRTLPKRPPTEATTAPVVHSIPGPMSSRWMTGAREHLIERAQQLINDHQRVLIVTPWRTRADTFARALEGSVLLHGDLNDGTAFRSWHRFLAGPACLITTRIGAWLAIAADIVLFDEPENDDHKQDEMAPRYDARLMLGWCAKNAGIPIEAYGVTPPLHVHDTGPTIDVPLTIHVRHPHGHARIPMLQMDTVEALREHGGPRTIIHPIRGMAARLRCRDCGWEASCPSCGFFLSAEVTGAHCKQCGKRSELPLACAACHGADLGKSMPGIDRLKLVWQREEPALDVAWRDLSNESMDAPFEEGTMVVVTDASLLGGHSEDIRRRERQCIAFRRLAERVSAAHGSLILQCDERLAEQWPAWLTTDGLAQFQNKEHAERALFRYPPAVRLVKAIVKGTEQKADQFQKNAARACGPSVEIRGPFLVPHTPKSREERRVWHLLFPRETTESVLTEQLTPLARSAIIDLDPIAFFR